MYHKWRKALPISCAEQRVSPTLSTTFSREFLIISNFNDIANKSSLASFESVLAAIAAGNTWKRSWGEGEQLFRQKIEFLR